ncbi:ankyrin repeat-containing protein NPR4-like isoform X1 [Daucus carota subsp. sativus]|uniref:ankyrin repeat-containing protein NPR4-like isoform X1 n=1 Tax=Daucus carota subsp. sativus TaxID=79200 RepID=UPI0030834C66
MGTDTLYAAAIAGDADAIAQLATKADRLNLKGETILHTESRNGNAEHVRFILREFADKNLLSKLCESKYTALSTAIDHGRTEVAGILIDAARQWPINSFQDFLRLGNYWMDTALHIAVTRKNVDVVKLLVEADPSDTHTHNKAGETPMYIAVKAGFNDIAEIISTTCSAPYLYGRYGSSAVLIKNVDHADSSGGTLYEIMNKDALYVAAIAGNAGARAALEMQADKVDNVQPILQVESSEGNTEHVRFILSEFANKNLLTKLNSINETALHWAAYKGHTEVAEILIDAASRLPPSDDDSQVTSSQAFLRQADKHLRTALHNAVMKDNVAIVKLLLEADPSDTHSKNDWHFTLKGH